MSLSPMQLQGLPAIPADVAARASEEFSELSDELRKELTDASGESRQVLLALRQGNWVELRAALLRLHVSRPKAGYDRLANEVLENLG